MVLQIYTPTSNVRRVAVFVHFCQHLVLSVFLIFIFSYSGRVYSGLHCSFNFIFLMTNEVGHFFILGTPCWLATWIFAFEVLNLLFFKKNYAVYFSLFILICSSFCILGAVLLDICIASIFYFVVSAFRVFMSWWIKVPDFIEVQLINWLLLFCFHL